MKKVLIFSLNYYPFVGGAEVAIKEITDRIAPEDIEFHLVAYRFDGNLPRTERVGNVTVHRVGWAPRGMTFGQSFSAVAYLGKVLYVPLATSKALVLHHRERFDGAWAMMTYMVFPLVLMRAVGVHIPYVLTLQEGDPFEHVFDRWRIRLVSPLLFSGIRNASTVQAISSFLGEWACRAGFKGTLEIVPNGVETARFAEPTGTEAHAAARRALGLVEGDVALVTTSRLVRKNAVDDVIRALALLSENVHFVIYGIGPDEGDLRRLAKEQGVESRTHFMGQISHADMPRALKACDIFIRPSRSEGMGNSFIEAMAAELPVIATQEGGIADFLFDARRNPDREPTGWAVDKDAPEQIAGAVEDIMEHPEQVARVKATAKKLAFEKYDWSLIAARMRALFDRLLANG